MNKIKNLYIREISLTLDLVAMGMEAGLDFNMALDRVIRFGPKGILFPHLNEVTRDISLGKGKLDALKKLQKNTNMKCLKGLIQAIHLSETFGGNLANLLQTYAQNLKQERLNQGEKQAQQIPVKLLFPLIFLIFPSIFIVLLGPILLQFFESGAF